MILRRSGMPRAVAACLVSLTVTAIAPLVVSSVVSPVRAATGWVAGGALPQLGAGRIWSVAIDPAIPTTVIAGTDNGVYRSEDAGVTWTASSFTGSRVWSVGFDGRTTAALAGVDRGGVQRSDDAGKTWTASSAGLASGRTVRSLAFGVDLEVAGTDDGVDVSTDNGHTWEGAGLRGYDVSAVGVAANTPKTVLLAGVDSAPSGAGPGFLFRNTGPGPTWETVGVGPTAAIVSAVCVGARPGTTSIRPLLVTTNLGVYQSNDGGTSGNWTKAFPAANADNQTQTLTACAYSPVDPNLVYAGDDAGGSGGGLLLRSTDAGLTFNPADTGLPADTRNVAALAVAPANPPLVVAAVDAPSKGGQIFVETDSSAPTPAPLAPPEPGAAIPSSAPALPSFTPVPTAAPPSVAATTGDSRLRRLVNWPIPLAIEVLVLVLLGYGSVTWYQRRMDIEGPP